MRRALRQAFEAELKQGYAAMHSADCPRAYHHFERAHVLGQRWVVPHTRSHWAFLTWAWQCRDLREMAGQLLRIPAGMLGSALGWVPLGNTGGARVSAIKSMPVPEDLKSLLQGR